MRYELTDLKVFLAIASAGSLSAGAEAMHITAPSASYRLKNLEQALGCVLFARSPRGMLLTAAGIAVKAHADKVMGSVARLDADVRAHASGVIGNIRLFANSSTLSSLTPILPAYLNAFPGVNIDLFEHLSEESIRAVLDDEADIGLVAGPVDVRGLEATPYGQDELVFICHPSHALADQERTSLGKALEHDLIAVSRDSSNFKYLLSLALNIGMVPKVRVHAPSFSAVIRCVQDRAGIALVPRSVAAPDISAGRVVAVTVAEPWAVRLQQIITKSRHELPEYAQSLIRMISGEAAI